MYGDVDSGSDITNPFVEVFTDEEIRQMNRRRLKHPHLVFRGPFYKPPGSRPPLELLYLGPGTDDLGLVRDNGRIRSQRIARKARAREARGKQAGAQEPYGEHAAPFPRLLAHALPGQARRRPRQGNHADGITGTVDPGCMVCRPTGSRRPFAGSDRPSRRRRRYSRGLTSLPPPGAFL